MKATFDKQKLLSAISPPAGISQTKNTLTSVDGLLFECPPNPKYGDYDTDRDDLCRISAFDLEKGLRTTVECKIYEKGMFIINTVKILQIVRSLPDGEVTLDIDDKGHVMIKSGFSHFEISATPGEEFPSMPMFIGERVYRIPQYRLKRLIDETVFAVAQNDSRAAYNGAFFKIENGEMTAVGCDGNRLSAAKFTLDPYAEVSAADRVADDDDILVNNGKSSDAELIIPGKFLNELTKLLKDSEDEITMIIGRRHVFFKIGEIYFFTRVIDTSYFAYEKLFPKTYMTEIYVSRDDMIGACERASIVTEDKLGGAGRTHMKLEISDGAIVMSSVSSGGSVNEKIPVRLEGADLTIGFNCRFLLDALRASPAGCGMLRLRLNSPLMGMVIEPAEGSGFISAAPDKGVFGEDYVPRAYVSEDDEADISDKADKSDKSDRERDEFLYFVAPVRLHN